MAEIAALRFAAKLIAQGKQAAYGVVIEVDGDKQPHTHTSSFSKYYSSF
jgi:hypothetical protein